MVLGVYINNLRYTPHGRLTLRSAIIRQWLDDEPASWTKRQLIDRRARAHGDVYELEPIAARKTIQLPNCKVHLFKPTHSGRPLPVIIAYHGGGFFYDFVPMAEAYYRHLANQTGFLVVAPDYRVAPEHPFPAATNDSYETFKWVLANIAREDGDPARIAVWGDSAGGNLAAVVTQKARDEGLTDAIDLQILVYPAVDMYSEESESFRKFGVGYILSQASMEFIRNVYTAGADCRNPEISPLLHKNFGQLPPCLLVTAEFDPLHDQAIAYAKRLEKAGIEVHHREFKGMLHGFVGPVDVFPHANDRFMEMAVEFLSVLKTKKRG